MDSLAAIQPGRLEGLNINGIHTSSAFLVRNLPSVRCAGTLPSRLSDGKECGPRSSSGRSLYRQRAPVSPCARRGKVKIVSL